MVSVTRSEFHFPDFFHVLKFFSELQVKHGFYDEKRISFKDHPFTRFDARRDATGRMYEYQCPSAALVQRDNRGEGLKDVRITQEELAKIRDVLQVYEVS